MIDLHDFETKQIVVNPFFKSEHGGAFVTPNTEYVMEATQYAAPFSDDFVPLEEFNEKYRGGLTYWKFDNEKGRLDPANSFTFELPPYSQDLSDAGKVASEGWGFTNSFCSERYVGGIERGRPPFEAGCSQKDTDFLHVTNWKKAEELVKAGKVKKEKGMYLIPMEQAVKEGLLYLIPEPKSPHGVDVSPDGKYIIVSGKLDSHAWVYSWDKIQKAINDQKFEDKDPYGIPIIAMKDALHTQVQVGLGPLHSQYDAKKCVVYTSIYVDSMVTKWDYCEGKVLDQINIHYNIGHLVTMEGDSVSPDGKYLVALNKLAIDRFNPVGPLHPQNHQLIDISGDKMQLLYDMPLPLGEPHYVVAIKADKLQARGALQIRLGQPCGPGLALQDPGRPGKDRAGRGWRGACLRHPDPLAHHPGDHRGGRGRYRLHPSDQPGTGGRRDPWFRHVRTERAAFGRTGQDGLHDLQGGKGRCLSLLLHRVLLRAPSGDAGLSAGQTERL